MNESFLIFNMLFWLLLIGGLFYFFSSIRRRRKRKPRAKPLFNVTKEEAVREMYLFLSVLFVGVTLLSFNSDFHRPLSWHTILLLTSATAILYAYAFRINSALLFGLISLQTWWWAQAFEWSDVERIASAGVMTGTVCISLLIYATGHLHETRRKFGGFSPIYFGLGVVFISIILFFFSTSSGIRFLEDMGTGLPFYRSWRLSVSLLVLAGLLVSLLLYLLLTKRMTTLEICIALVPFSIFVVTAFLPGQDLFLERRFSSSALSAAGIFWALFFNVLFFLELLGLILLGYKKRNEQYVNIGALFLFVFIIVKYVDWFFKFLDKSVFFIGAGILLFVVGWLMERGRRYMLAQLERAN